MRTWRVEDFEEAERNNSLKLRRKDLFVISEQFRSHDIDAAADGPKERQAAGTTVRIF